MMKNESFLLFGVMKMKNDGKVGGWNFPPMPTKNYPSNLGGKSEKRLFCIWNLLFYFL